MINIAIVDLLMSINCVLSPLNQNGNVQQHLTKQLSSASDKTYKAAYAQITCLISLMPAENLKSDTPQQEQIFNTDFS